MCFWILGFLFGLEFSALTFVQGKPTLCVPATSPYDSSGNFAATSLLTQTSNPKNILRNEFPLGPLFRLQPMLQGGGDSSDSVTDRRPPLW